MRIKHWQTFSLSGLVRVNVKASKLLPLKYLRKEINISTSTTTTDASSDEIKGNIPTTFCKKWFIHFTLSFLFEQYYDIYYLKHIIIYTYILHWLQNVQIVVRDFHSLTHSSIHSTHIYWDQQCPSTVLGTRITSVNSKI